MRMSTDGILNLDLSLSISYDSSRGWTCALLNGCSTTQQASIQRQITEWAALANHPLLLPIILATMKRQTIADENSLLWNILVDVETRSGVNEAPALIALHPPRERSEERNFENITKDALVVIQRASYVETHTKSLLLFLEAMKDIILEINATVPEERKRDMEMAGSLLSERMEFITHKTRVMLTETQVTEKRAQAQLAAVCCGHILGLSTIC